MMEHKRFGDPGRLAPARAVAHAAAQLLYRAAVANIAPMPADEHTNLEWDSAGHLFKTHPLDGGGLAVCLRLAPLTLSLGGRAIPLDGTTVEDALSWLDDELSGNDLSKASDIDMIEDLPEDVIKLKTFSAIDGLDALAAWFDLAAATLQDFAVRNAELSPGPSPVRCWPHHFDIATYVSLEAGDAEEARGVGVGMSPGDGSYDQPYFYVNAWPHLDVARLPAAVSPGHWHTEGFVGLIATGTEILDRPDVQVATADFLWNGFQSSRKALAV